MKQWRVTYIRQTSCKPTALAAPFKFVTSVKKKPPQRCITTVTPNMSNSWNCLVCIHFIYWQNKVIASESGLFCFWPVKFSIAVSLVTYRCGGDFWPNNLFIMGLVKNHHRTIKSEISPSPVDYWRSSVSFKLNQDFSLRSSRRTSILCTLTDGSAQTNGQKLPPYQPIVKMSKSPPARASLRSIVWL